MSDPNTRSGSFPADTIEAIRRAARPLTGEATDHDCLLQLIGDARFVLLGEATHGTFEFYHERATITRRLIEEKGFHAVAVEADWPSAYRINRYVCGASNDQVPLDALGDFKRFPGWLWRNQEVLEFTSWLTSYNENPDHRAQPVGFFGLDLYSLQASMEAVLTYLDQVDPLAAHRARTRYACFDHFAEDSQRYGYAANFGLTRSCENEVVDQLLDLRQRGADYAARDGFVGRDEFFFAEQNARLVKNAEQYYRSMFRDRITSWNLRDQHMAETLENLDRYLSEQWQVPAKIVVWEHNSHLGDARATQMGRAGEWSVGQLIREKYSTAARLIGFTTSSGTVTAAGDWDEPAIRKKVSPPLTDSYEELFHNVGIPRFTLDLRNELVADHLRQPRLERAIGVIYRPESERISHYFTAQLADQFDAVIHLDETRALEPLDRVGQWQGSEVAETFPSGL